MIGVLDTSALIRLYIPDGPIPEGLEGFMESVDNGKADVLIPGLLWQEAASVLLKKSRRGELTPAEGEELLSLWRSLPLTEVDTGPEIERIFCLARDENLSAYDATFLHLALNFRARLFTADDKLQSVATRLLSSPR